QRQMCIRDRSQGGDLGTFTRGQMVKAFEDAAFSQKKNVVGPPVETEYGYHLIEVLERHPPRLQPLDGPTKERIRTFLMQKKRYEAFQELMASLKQKADIKIVANLE
ncbi:MAG: peptidylprolyl isomerase, partial [Syntrophales bacterium]|nr:peptidylprolyl isomerase [Syntrophales bacterium]